MPITVHVRRVLLFAPSEGGDTTAPSYGSSEAGDVTNATIVAVFSENIVSALDDYVTGVTIKHDAVGQTISSGTRQANHSIVHYVIADTGSPAAVITFEYSDALGDIADEPAGNQLGDIAAQTVLNNIGHHLRFTDRADMVQAILTLHL